MKLLPNQSDIQQQDMKQPKFRLRQLISSPLVERRVNRECSISLHVQRLQLLTLRYTCIDHHLFENTSVRKVLSNIIQMFTFGLC